MMTHLNSPRFPLKSTDSFLINDPFQWCQCFVSQLASRFALSYVAFLIEQEDELDLWLSWSKERGITHYTEKSSLEFHQTFSSALVFSVKEKQSWISESTHRGYRMIWPMEEAHWLRLCVPIFFDGQILGYLYTELLSADDHVILANMLSQSIEAENVALSACLFSAESKRQAIKTEYLLVQQSNQLSTYHRRLERLHSLIFKLMQVPSLNELYRESVALGCFYLEVDRVAIFLVDQSENQMFGTFGTDPDGNLVDRRCFISALPDHPLVNNALENRDYMVVKEDAPLYFGREQVGIGWNAMIALWDDVQCLGWIAVDNLISQTPFDEDLRGVLKLFGLALSVQISAKRNHETLIQFNQHLECRVKDRTEELEIINRQLALANQDLIQLALLDGLTSVANRRAFNEQICCLFQDAKTHQRNPALLILDIDYFKQFNDHYGHLNGDDCLRKISSSLNNFAQSQENVTFYRYGGEEFAFLFSNISFCALEEFSFLLQAVINNLAICHEKSLFQRVTVSVGGCLWSHSNTVDIKQWITVADKALYRAKSQGRNGFVLDKI
jgi:diguanylate cyclase (GGDEF)-like protein